jgi:putative hemolysin
MCKRWKNMNKILSTTLVSLFILAACTNNNVEIPNPASQYCVNKGGNLEIVTASDGSQSGICTLKDGTKCDEWAYYRNECPGIKCNLDSDCVLTYTGDELCVCDLNNPNYKCVNKDEEAKILAERQDKYNNVGVCAPCPIPDIRFRCECNEGLCSKEECGECPFFSPPGPGFCTDGTITDGGKDHCGCQLPPKCEYSSITQVLCGGWDTFGDVVCKCNGTVHKEPCPANTVCDSGNTWCNGICSICTCYSGPSSGNKVVNCNGREKLFTESSGEKKNYCTPEQKKAEICTLEYSPVCGWFNQNIKCFKYPCASTFGNKCEACSAENVEYWTAGECPSDNNIRKCSSDTDCSLVSISNCCNFTAVNNKYIDTVASVQTICTQYCPRKAVCKANQCTVEHA